MSVQQGVSGPYHRVRFPYDPRRATVWRSICRYLQRYVRPDEPLLDLGAGYGEFSRFIRSGKKWALDENPELASFWPPGVHALIQSALLPIPLESDSLGTVFASNFFEHFTIDECRSILAELSRVLRPGGRLVVVQPNFRLEPRRYYDDYTHKTAFTHVGFADLLRSVGWRIVHQEPRFIPFSMNMGVPKFGWLVAAYLATPFRLFAGQFLVVAETL